MRLYRKTIEGFQSFGLAHHELFSGHIVYAVGDKNDMITPYYCELKKAEVAGGGAAMRPDDNAVQSLRLYPLSTQNDTDTECSYHLYSAEGVLEGPFDAESRSLDNIDKNELLGTEEEDIVRLVLQLDILVQDVLRQPLQPKNDFKDVQRRAYYGHLLAKLYTNGCVQLSPNQLRTIFSELCDEFEDSDLFYTAVSNQVQYRELILLLCGLAISTAKLIHDCNPKESVSAIELLIPRLSTQSAYPHSFPDLNSSELNSSPEMLLGIFQTHVVGHVAPKDKRHIVAAIAGGGAACAGDGELQAEDNHRFLIPVCVLAQPHASDRNCSGLSTEPTFRGLSAESRNPAPSLDPSDKPLDVGDGRAVISDLEKAKTGEYPSIRIEDDWSCSFPNPYYIEGQKDKTFLLNHETLERLKRFLPKTEAIFQSSEAYQKLLVKNDESLYQRLMRLCQKMRQNIALAGVGTPDAMEAGGNIAIKDFYQYYDLLTTLDSETGQRNTQTTPEIPEVIIAKLNELEAWPKQVKASRCPLTYFKVFNGRCPFTYVSELTALVKKDQTTLSQIIIDGENKNKVMESCKQLFETNQSEIRETLSGWLAQHTAQELKVLAGAEDRLGVTRKMLGVLGITDKYKINHMGAFESFMHKPPKTIQELCGLPNIYQDIQNVLRKGEGALANLAQLVTNHAAEQLAVLFEGCEERAEESKNILISRILNPSELIYLMEMMGESKRQAFVSSIHMNTVLFLSKDQQISSDLWSMLWDVIKDQLDSIQDVGELYILLNASRLTDEQYDLVWNANESRLGSLIQDMDQFYTLFDDVRLTEKQGALLCRIAESDLDSFIKNADQLLKLLLCKQLSLEKRIMIWNRTKERLGELIENGDQFIQLLLWDQLSCEDIRMICALKVSFNECTQLKDISELINFLKISELTEEMRTAILNNAMGRQLIALLRKAGAFVELLKIEQLTDEHRTIVLKAVKHILSSVLDNNVSQFLKLLHVPKLTQTHYKIIWKNFTAQDSSIYNVIDAPGYCNPLADEQISETATGCIYFLAYLPKNKFCYFETKGIREQISAMANKLPPCQPPIPDPSPLDLEDCLLRLLAECNARLLLREKDYSTFSTFDSFLLDQVAAARALLSKLQPMLDEEANHQPEPVETGMISAIHAERLKDIAQEITKLSDKLMTYLSSTSAKSSGIVRFLDPSDESWRVGSVNRPETLGDQAGDDPVAGGGASAVP